MQPPQVEHFRTHGYVIVEEFFTPVEVAAMRAEVERFERDELLRNVTTDGDGKTHSRTKANLQLCPMSPHSELFRALPFEPRVREAVDALIGPPAVLHLDQVFLKPPRHGAGTGWHQDNAYFKIADPLKGTAMWVAVHDGTVANGTLHVIPNGFRAGIAHDRDPGSDHHIHCAVDEAEAVACEVEAGGVVFFCYGTPHCTKSNDTDSPRAGAAFHFLREDCFDRPAHEGRPCRNPVLTGPRASDGTQEYGERIAGAWPRLVAALARDRAPVAT